MTFIAEFRVEIPVLYRASKAVPEMRFSGEDIVLEDDRPHKFVFTAHGTRFDAFEQALAADPTVAEYAVLTKAGEKAYYVVTYAETVDTKGTYHVAVEEDVAYLNVELQDGEYTVRARFPDRDALRTLGEYYHENDVPFRVDRIYYEEREATRYDLTDAQREALVLAHERGYFDSPRETKLAAIADELGISRQAVADRLRRGHRRLIGATIA